MAKMKILALAALFALPTASFAATYHYVDTSGTVRSVEASSEAEAMMRATNRDPNSGVAIDLGVIDSGDSVLGTTHADANESDADYFYVDASGIVRGVDASTASEAFVEASSDIAVHSGVAADMGVIEENVSVTAQ